MAPLTRDASNLLWIDCEMTGLNAHMRPRDWPAEKPWQSDRIIEIAAIATSKDLEPLDEGVRVVIRTSQDVLDNMNDWCIDQHGKTGLTAECLASDITMEMADDIVSMYVHKHFPEDSPALLAGSSVHADKTFIQKDLPKLASRIHYRILDVSSIKELCRRWYPDLPLPPKEDSQHRAMSDILASIRELQFYRRTLFRTEAETKAKEQSNGPAP